MIHTGPSAGGSACHIDGRTARGKTSGPKENGGMRERNRPFVLYIGGLTGYWIKPRGGRGWVQFILWLALLVPLVLWVVDHAAQPHAKSDHAAGFVLFGAGVLAWLVGGLWWMLARAEVVQMVEVRRARQYARREKEREERLKREQQAREGQPGPPAARDG